MKRSYGDKSFAARRIFTDREEPMALARGAIDRKLGPGERRVVTWYGVGGQGKTSLCQEITKQLLKTEGIALAALDFEQQAHRDCETAILALRIAFGRSSQLNFPAFDLAYTMLFKKRHPSKTIRAVHPELFKQSHFVAELDECLKLASEGVSIFIPGVSFFYKYLKKYINHRKESKSQAGLAVKVAELDGLTTSQIIERLPALLAEDLFTSRQTSDCPRLVITIDAHEKLWEGRSKQGSNVNSQPDLWLRNLVKESGGVLFLVFGRDKLRWVENHPDPEWNNILDQHLLGGLSDQDANSFLEGIPIAEADIRSRIVKASGGLPYYLDLAVDLYAEKREDGIVPSLDDFGKTDTDAMDRFLAHLDETEQRELRLASYPETLERSLFHELVDHINGGKKTGNFERLLRRSFMTERGDCWVMHSMMRDALQQQEKDNSRERYEEVHQYLFRRNDELITSDTQEIAKSDEAALLAASYHGRRLPAELYVEWLDARALQFSDAGRWAVLEQLFTHSHPTVPPNSGNGAWSEDWLARAIDDRGGYSEAEPLFRNALEIRERVFGPVHLTTACAYNNLGSNLGQQGQFVEAEKYLRKALNIREQILGPDHAWTAMCCSNLANNLTHQKRASEAEPFLRRALSTMKRTSGCDHPDVATIYNNLASNLLAQNRPGDAEEAFRKALEIREQKLGPNHPYTAQSYDSLALTLKESGRLNEAELLLRRALELREQTFGRDHPETAQSYMDVADCLLDAGNPPEAQELYAKAAEIRERVLGLRHASTAISYNQLACSLEAQGNLSEAESLFQKAFQVSRDVSGLTNVRTIQARFNLANVIEAQHKNHDAERIWREMLESLKNADVHRHHETAKIYNRLGINLYLQGKLVEAEEPLRSAVNLEAGTPIPDKAALERYNADNFGIRGALGREP